MTRRPLIPSDSEWHRTDTWAAALVIAALTLITLLGGR